MDETLWYILFLLAWMFVQSLWISRLAKQVESLEERVVQLEGSAR